MSTKGRIYLDFNATAPLADAARVAMADAMAEVGNPSSIHAEGRRARDRVERARTQVAVLAGRPREQIVFTSGGTEANVLGVSGLARVAEARGVARRAYVAAIDHPSLRGAVAALATRGWEVVGLPVGPRGEVEPPTGELGLVAITAVNHELGTVPAIARFAELVAGRGGPVVHVDAVQAAGKLDLAAYAFADSLALSAHKIGGPQGTGALAIAADAGLPLVEGGHQERGRRPGTENTIGIAGFGAAAAGLELAAWPRVVALGERLEAGLRALGARIHGEGMARVGGTINAAFPGALGESIVIALDLAGVATSTGSACTSGSVQPSPVLLALGLPPAEAREAVRFSLGRTTTADEIDEVLRLLPEIVSRARKHR